MVKDIIYDSDDMYGIPGLGNPSPTRSRPVSWPPGLGLAGFQTVYGHGSGVPGPGQCMMAIARGTRTWVQRQSASELGPLSASLSQSDGPTCLISSLNRKTVTRGRLGGLHTGPSGAGHGSRSGRETAARADCEICSLTALGTAITAAPVLSCQGTGHEYLFPVLVTRVRAGPPDSDLDAA